jgi:hypothetical protein
MVPALVERVRKKQALDVAMEVQQNFLSQQMHKIKGFGLTKR